MVNSRPRSGPGLIVTRTPLRVSFAGGGTDTAAFYERDIGAVFSTAINKYIYVTVKRHSNVFLESIRVNYSKSETVQRIDEIENDIARECLRFLRIEPPIYISTVGDLPASTGLGGSSSFAVGLLNALHILRRERVSAGQLAEEAAQIEIDLLQRPIGKQDQYAAAFGGLNLFCFRTGGRVTVEPQRLADRILDGLFRRVMMFWTGHQRDAGAVLAEQQARTTVNLDRLGQMREQAHQLQALTCNDRFDPRRFGQILHEGWQLKRGLASTITSDEIDQWYDRAMAAGADGGKLCGAGGGGFLLFLVSPARQEAVRQALQPLQEISVDFEVHGSSVLLPSLD